MHVSPQALHMASGFHGIYTTRASGDTFQFMAAWDYRDTCLAWQAHIRVGGRLIDGMHGSITDVDVDVDMASLVTIMIRREIERLNQT
jgi:hypothetical protein